jgi:hypothetical protein
MLGAQRLRPQRWWRSPRGCPGVGAFGVWGVCVLGGEGKRMLLKEDANDASERYSLFSLLSPLSPTPYTLHPARSAIAVTIALLFPGVLADPR